MYAMMQVKRKSENSAHILGYQTGAVTLVVPSRGLDADGVEREELHRVVGPVMARRQLGAEVVGPDDPA